MRHSSYKISFLHSRRSTGNPLICSVLPVCPAASPTSVQAWQMADANKEQTAGPGLLKSFIAGGVGGPELVSSLSSNPQASVSSLSVTPSTPSRCVFRPLPPTRACSVSRRTSSPRSDKLHVQSLTVAGGIPRSLPRYGCSPDRCNAHVRPLLLRVCCRCYVHVTPSATALERTSSATTMPLRS